MELSSRKSYCPMYQEIINKANRIRANHPERKLEILESEGMDLYNLNGRLLKSIFTDENDQPLSFESRTKLMRELLDPDPSTISKPWM